MSLRKPKRILAALLILICMLSMPGAMATQAADSQQVGYPGLTIEGTIGYDGAITYLRKLPVRITLKNDGADFSGVLAMNVSRNDEEFDRYEMPVAVAGGAVVAVEMPVELTMRQQKYEAELMVNGERVAAYPLSVKRLLAPSTMLVGVLGGNSLTHMHITAGKDPLKRKEQWQTVPLTTEIFPTDEKMLEFFTFIVIDGFDTNELDAQQQQALERWLQNGGVLIIGGGAQAGTGYPYFQKYTGISAGAPYQGEDITPTILSYLKSAEKPFEGEMLLAEIKGGKHTVIAQEGGALLDVSPVGNGYIMTAAFSLSDKPFITWQGDMVLWQRLMLAAISDRYQRISTIHADYYERGSYYVDAWVTRLIQVPGGGEFTLPILLLLLFVFLVGVGSYYWLCKRDKREWLWLTIPGFSLLFAVIFAFMSAGTTLNEPVLGITDFVFKNAEGVVTENVGIGYATGTFAPVTVAVENGELIMPENGFNYFASDSPRKEQTKLRNTYQQGDKPSVTFPAITPWEVGNAIIRGTNPPQIEVEGECWFEEDGLHIRLKNNGITPLAKSHIITSYGYCSVSELLPGQSAEYFLEKPEETAKTRSSAVNGNYNTPIVDGRMLTKVQLSSMDTYSIFHALVYPELYTDSSVAGGIDPQVYEKRQWQRGLYEQVFTMWNGVQRGVVTNQFHLVTLDDSICQMTFTLNGKPVKRTAQLNLIDVELAYVPVSPSGFVKYGVGSIPVYLGEKGTSNSPSRGAVISERYRYFRLADQPTFCFVLPQESKKIDLADIGIVPQYVYTDYNMALYNNKTKEWDDVNMTKELLGQFDFSLYVNGENEIYVQFSPGTTADNYADMGTPQMSLEGRLR